MRKTGRRENKRIKKKGFWSCLLVWLAKKIGEILIGFN